MAVEHEIVGRAHQIGERLADRSERCAAHPEPQFLEQVLGILAGAARAQKAQQCSAIGDENRLEAGESHCDFGSGRRLCFSR